MSNGYSLTLCSVQELYLNIYFMNVGFKKKILEEMFIILKMQIL